jgi:CHAT domain-containing protein
MRNLGVLAQKEGKDDEALASTRDALAILVRQERGFGAEEVAEHRESVRSLCDFCLVLAMRLSKEGAPRIEDAFEFAESSRGMLLAEALTNRRALLDANVPEVLADVERRARAALARHQEEARALPRDADRPARLEARRRIDAAYAELEAAQARIQREARHVAEVVFPAPVRLETLRSHLPPDTALLLYQQTRHDAVVVWVRREGAGFLRLGDAESTVSKAEAYRELAMAGREGEPVVARELYDLLLRPAEPHLHGVRRILVAPDGVLALVPFEALLRAEGEARERVLERLEVAYVPSGTVYAALREEAGTPPGRGVLALGDPVYPDERASTDGLASSDADLRGWHNLSRLPATADEVRAVAALFGEGDSTALLRQQATVAGLREALAKRPSRLRALHLACHGYVDTERPRLTGLVLGGGEVLTLDDVYRLRVPADLVVLSACETAGGRLQRCEGVMGLVRGFFFAGTPRVVVSNWKVADDSTRVLMERFYAAMLKKGLAPCAALRDAKLGMLRGGGRDAQPRHWAAFVLWGLAD